MSRFRLIVTILALAAMLCPHVLVAQAPGTSPKGARAGVRSTGAVQDVPKQPVFAGTRVTAFTSIQGNALSSTNAPLPNAFVRLRDARLGRIVAVERTDQSGLFVFRNVDPGTYIIELLGDDDRVLAASDILNVDAGQTVTAVVKLPFRVSALEGLFGPSTASAVTVIAAGAAAGVLSIKATTSRTP
jgi:hypothetical protein